MAGYEQYRMTDWGWVKTYQQKMGFTWFHDYMDKVYAFLFKMKPGEVFDIEKNVKEENIELFIKIVCTFISEDNYNYDFTNDFKKVRCHAKGDLELHRKKLLARELGKIDSQANSRASRENRECGQPVHTPETINSPRKPG